MDLSTFPSPIAAFFELERRDQGALMIIGGAMIFDLREDGQAPSLEEVQDAATRVLGALPRYTHPLRASTPGLAVLVRGIERGIDELRDLAGHDP